jgi:guanylate kinase
MGVLLSLCGPSGVGKSSLCARLLGEFPRLAMSVSYTTRAPRGAEQDGVHYHFVTRGRFEEMAALGAFAERAEVHGNLYGTARATIEGAWASDRDVLFDIDYQGAQQLRAAYPHARAVLLLPPSMEVLEARLRGRGTDAPEVIERRLRKAKHELEQWESFDFALVNGDLEVAYGQLRAVYLALRQQVHVMRPEVEALLR